jgi:hypothetical protein
VALVNDDVQAVAAKLVELLVGPAVAGASRPSPQESAT